MEDQWKKLDDLCQIYHYNVKWDEPLSAHTTFRIGGKAKALVSVSSCEMLMAVTALCRKENWEHMVLGNGSNVLVSDKGYNGVVIVLGKDFSKVRIEENRIICQAGATLASVGRMAMEASLTGMECLSGIPGTVGGGLYMNAGAYGGEIRDIIVSAKCLTRDGTVVCLTPQEMQLGYRQSIFKEGNLIVMELTLELQPGEYGKIHDEMEELRGKRRAKQPLELPSAGSTFKRPVGSYASLLIDQCGLKGASVGDAQVSVKHAGFVVNTGKATCQQVLELCNYVQQTVKEKTGYWLELEPELVGEMEEIHD